ncbi:class I SAM-dependent methyltransferase [Plantactinospora siamensis]|uniref:Class I SAM-dependent methyltransferase n=1 Tax=Plantactinospora siamensis TaxID=555372 RepID=A0ABV6NTD2_9ACTN
MTGSAPAPALATGPTFAAVLGADARPRPYWLIRPDGRWTPLPVRRWHGPAEPAVRWLVARCAGPTLDVGCGPGRAVAAVARRGLPALGIDTSPVAVRLTRRRGAAALCRDVFEELPGEGRWAHVLLLDGNIGIGGDPAALLRRCAALLRPGGTTLVEVDAPGAGGWAGPAHLAYGRGAGPARRGPAFHWAGLASDLVHRYVPAGALTVQNVLPVQGRWFVELVRSR